MSEPAVIEPLIRQHAEDAAFLFVQRAGECDGQSFGEMDIARRDRRIAAHLDGLLAAGAAGWRMAREQAETYPEAGEHFVCVALALAAGQGGWLEAALAAAGEAGAAGARGASGAAAWTPAAALRPHVRGWMSSPDPRQRLLGLAAASHHRVDPRERLAEALADPVAGVRARAARLAGEIGRRDLVPALTALLDDPDCRFPAAWSLARLGARSPALDALEEIAAAAPESAAAGRALDMRLLADAPEGAKACLTRLLDRPALRALALSRVGVGGDASVLPWLVRRMRDPADAPAAGAAFRDLFPVDIDNTDLFTGRPEVLGEAFAGLDPQPLPVADRIAIWAEADGLARLAEEPPFLSLRVQLLAALRAGVAAPGAPLGRWRQRRSLPAWV